MDDELKGMLGQILTVVEATRDDVKVLNTRVGSLETKVERLQAGQAELQAGQAGLQAGVAELQVGQAELQADVAELQAGQAELQADVAEIRRVVGGNYLKLHGRIDQLSDMFMGHVNRHHGSGDSKPV